MLLQAEVHYTDGDIQSAERSYAASIKAARDHRFLHHEALAYELYGMCLVETQQRKKGAAQLRLALDRYERWGAGRKVEHLQEVIASVDKGNG